MIQEFKAFISRGNVVDLAVGIIIGAAFTAIVTSLVNDILMPPLGWILGGLDFTNYFIVLGSGDYATLESAKAAGAATINYGLFVNAVIKFLIVAWALFILIKQVNRFRIREEAKPTAPPKQEILLEEIRDLLKARGGMPG
ncbi:MAG: hypothetical protein RLY86_2977 [Pseudomonadota bacterium]|jgi:large conductance mechanosensitive channel